MSVPLSDDLRLRELAPTDGPAIKALIAASPDTGAIRFRPEYQIDPYLALTFTGGETGVVVERPATGELVGLGMVGRGDIVIRGAARPFALLHSLVVHPEVRRRGVGGAIIAWRIGRARERDGDDVILIATIQMRNEGSFRAASRWASQVTRPLSAIAIGMRPRPPGRSAGVVVRPAAPADLEAFADRHAAFRCAFDLWAPVAADRLATWLRETPLNEPIHELWVAADRDGNLLAGLGVTTLRAVSVLHVDAMPFAMRAVNALVHLVPASGRLDQVAMDRAWYQPGAEQAARYLFEAIRWELRDRGNVVLAAFDPLGPLRHMIVTPRWLPKTALSLAIRAPLPVRADHTIEGVQ